jgi:hypothetical protein
MGGAGTHMIDQVQNVNAGSTDRPNTSVSTMKMEIIAHVTRPACAGVTREEYHKEVEG